jgi:hypothetical protein
MTSLPRLFDVCPYSKNLLIDLFSRKSSKHRVSKKNHLEYLDGYFSHPNINSKTVVVEDPYIDRDYLEDHSGYYARCFNKYERECTRLHFFDISFSKDDFDNLLKNSQSSINLLSLQESYIGFLVVKPIPETFIGRTCLKTYSEHESGRSFPSLRSYKVNLFGISLTIKSLAFQEQDRVVAACATSALWSLFHSTGNIFDHPIPSPLEITKAATTHSSYRDRILPNKDGLIVEQMATAIRNVSLEPNFINVNTANSDIGLRNEINAFNLTATIYSYLKYGIPSVLLFTIIRAGGKIEGHHAVTIAGYGLDQGSPKPYSWLKGIQIQNSSIDRIYVHDDQVGPFAKMTFDGDYKDTNGLFSVQTSWGKEYDATQKKMVDTCRAIPWGLIIPLYHKIRIPFSVIVEAISEFDNIFKASKIIQPTIYSHHIIWDIHLIRVSQLKEELFNCKIIKDSCKREILIESMPRFIWRAKGFTNDKHVIDFLFDATDIEQGGFFLRAIEYDETLAKIFRIISNMDMVNYCQDASILKVFEWFKKN